MSENESQICDSCSTGKHLYCDGQQDADVDFARHTEQCPCISPIHRIEHEEGDDIYRLAGRIRGTIQLYKELIVNISTEGPDAVALRSLDDIADRIDRVGDNVAIVAHLLHNPQSREVEWVDINDAY